MPLFAYLLEPVRGGMVTDPTEAEHAVSVRHSEYLKSIHKSGRLRFAGRLYEDNGLGVVVVDVSDDAEARVLMDGDPLISEALMKGRCAQFASPTSFPRLGVPADFLTIDCANDLGWPVARTHRRLYRAQAAAASRPGARGDGLSGGYKQSRS